MSEPLAKNSWGSSLPPYIHNRMAEINPDERPSLRKLAAGSGVQVMILSRAFAGADISFDSAKKLARYLDVSLDDLAQHI